MRALHRQQGGEAGPEQARQQGGEAGPEQARQKRPKPERFEARK